MDEEYKDKREVRFRIDEDVYERIKFFRQELKNNGSSGSTNKVLRLLMEEAGWLPKRNPINDIIN